MEIADKLAYYADEAGADCIHSACGLCQINLDMKQTGANERKLPIFFFTELMGLAFDVGDRDVWWEKHLVSPKPLLRSLGLM
jgi:heterodisulfide reductase subunit B